MTKLKKLRDFKQVEGLIQLKLKFIYRSIFL